MEIKADVCIIGSGAGGATVAAELALAGLKVVVLEKGGKAPRPPIGESPYQSTAKAFEGKAYYGAVAAGSPPQMFLQGSCEGGSTAINNGNTFDLPRHIMDEWHEHGVENLSSYFERVDTFLRPAPLHDELISLPGRKMLAGLSALGWRGAPMMRNAAGCSGRNTCNVGCPEDAKRSANIAYLPEARKAGATVLLDTEVIRIMTLNKRATGVLARNRDGEVIIHSDRVILSAGSLNNPQILAKSGIDNPGIKASLFVHPAVAVLAEFEDNLQTKSPHVDECVYSDQFLESDNFMMMEMGLTGKPAALASLLSPSLAGLSGGNNTAVWASLIHDSQAPGELNSSIKRANGFRYDITHSTLQSQRTAVDRMAQAAFAAGARSVTPLYLGAPTLRSEADIARLPAELPRWRQVGVSLHPMGSCSIGRACSSTGQLHGYENLFVADASLFPASSGVTPQKATMALATMVASNIIMSEG